jgi:hypothetical protein
MIFIGYRMMDAVVERERMGFDDEKKGSAKGQKEFSYSDSNQG